MTLSMTLLYHSLFRDEAFAFGVELYEDFGTKLTVIENKEITRVRKAFFVTVLMSYKIDCCYHVRSHFVGNDQLKSIISI